MESEYLPTLLFKYAFIIFGLFAIAMLFVEYDLENAILDLYHVILQLAAGLGLIIIGLFLKNNLVRVRLGGQNITIIEGKDETLVNWFDVRSINALWIAFPPMYILRLKDEPGFYLFITESNAISFGITWDLSDMGRIIKRKKSELGI